MVIDLKDVFLNGTKNLIPKYTVSIDKFDIFNRYDISNCIVIVSGVAMNISETISIELNVHLRFDCRCDRCTSEVHNDWKYEFNHSIINSDKNNEEDSENLIAYNYKLDLNPVIFEDIMMSFPNKILCKTECRGMCQKCGTILNYSECSCRKQDIDLRLQSLKKLLD